MPARPEQLRGSTTDFVLGTKITSQARAQKSAEKVLAATCELLRERAFAEFTLNDVSQRAKVSIGSIVNRYAYKDNLIRTAMLAALEDYDMAERSWFQAALASSKCLREMVEQLVGIVTDGWLDHSVALKSMVHFAQSDEILRHCLDTQSERSEANAVEALLAFRNEFGSGVAEDKARFVNNAIRSIVSSNVKHRQPLVPTFPELPPALKRDLISMSLACLCGHS